VEPCINKRKKNSLAQSPRAYNSVTHRSRGTKIISVSKINWKQHLHVCPMDPFLFKTQCTNPQLSIMITYNGLCSNLIQWVRVILSGDQPTQKIPKKAYFLFVINLIKISKKIYHIGRSLKICGTMH